MNWDSTVRNSICSLCFEGSLSILGKCKFQKHQY